MNFMIFIFLHLLELKKDEEQVKIKIIYIGRHGHKTADNSRTPCICNEGKKDSLLCESLRKERLWSYVKRNSRVKQARYLEIETCIMQVAATRFLHVSRTTHAASITHAWSSVCKHARAARRVLQGRRQRIHRRIWYSTFACVESVRIIITPFCERCNSQMDAESFANTFRK